jgi:hypothetical protein
VSFPGGLSPAGRGMRVKAHGRQGSERTLMPMKGLLSKSSGSMGRAYPGATRPWLAVPAAMTCRVASMPLVPYPRLPAATGTRSLASGLVLAMCTRQL